MSDAELKAWAESWTVGEPDRSRPPLELAAAVLALIAERDEALAAHRGASARADRAETTLREAKAVALGRDGMTYEQALAAVVGLVATVREKEAKLAEAERNMEAAYRYRDACVQRAERCEAAEAKLAAIRSTLEHDGFDCPACLDPSPDAPHDISDRSCVYGPNGRTATEARAEAAEASLRKMADRVNRERARVEALEKALRERECCSYATTGEACPRCRAALAGRKP